jgi:hypothetical protein
VPDGGSQEEGTNPLQNLDDLNMGASALGGQSSDVLGSPRNGKKKSKKRKEKKDKKVKHKADKKERKERKKHFQKTEGGRMMTSEDENLDDVTSRQQIKTEG